VPVVQRVEDDIDCTATWRKLHGVGHEVVEDLLQFVSIEPHRQAAFQSLRTDRDALLFSIHGEDSKVSAQFCDDVFLFHMQS